MNTLALNKLKGEWLTEANFELVQKRRRRYLHFDHVLTKVTLAIYRKVTDPAFVAAYSFFPLIRRSQINRLYKRDAVLKEKIIKKKERPISYAAHFDALIYSWYSHLISDRYEKYIEKEGINDSVIAYRKLGRSNIEFSKEVFDFIKTHDECAVAAFDIKGFYDNLDTTILKGLWAKILGTKELPVDHYKVFRSVSNHAYVEWKSICKILNIGEDEIEKLRLFLNIDLLGTLRKAKEIKVIANKGIPQGTPISCVLSNLYMLPFDVAVKKAIQNTGGMYRRYSDDIIIVCTKDRLSALEKLIQSQIKKAKLEIEKTKTERRFFKQLSKDLYECLDENGKPSRLQYLGVEFNGANYTLRHKGRAKFEGRMVKAIRKEVRRVHGTKKPVQKHGIYEKFSPLGDMNYISYAKRAARGLKSPGIAKSFSLHTQHKKINTTVTKQKIVVAKPPRKRRVSK